MNTPTGSITDPSRIFRLFADAYRCLEPAIEINIHFDVQIQSVIDDISAGRDVTAFQSGGKYADKARRLSGGTTVRCSEMLLTFFDFLKHAMAEQGIARVGPARATELLYNFDAEDEHFNQPFLYLEDREGSLVLESYPKFDRRFGSRLRLVLSDFNSSDDWRIDPEGD
jgi:hypothetical protein